MIVSLWDVLLLASTFFQLGGCHEGKLCSGSSQINHCIVLNFVCTYYFSLCSICNNKNHYKMIVQIMKFIVLYFSDHRNVYFQTKFGTNVVLIN